MDTLQEIFNQRRELGETRDWTLAAIKTITRMRTRSFPKGKGNRARNRLLHCSKTTQYLANVLWLQSYAPSWLSEESFAWLQQLIHQAHGLPKEFADYGKFTSGPFKS